MDIQPQGHPKEGSAEDKKYSLGPDVSGGLPTFIENAKHIRDGKPDTKVADHKKE
jgi:hypothetical protein